MNVEKLNFFNVVLTRILYGRFTINRQKQRTSGARRITKHPLSLNCSLHSLYI
ncbi:hypothetical protein C0J52_13038 [Blattella germanica]|nr:hypothetical protein C0J52_13038 [Blattella germanica]